MIKEDINEKCIYSIWYFITDGEHTFKYEQNNVKLYDKLKQMLSLQKHDRFYTICEG